MKLAGNIVKLWGWTLRISNFRLKIVEGLFVFGALNTSCANSEWGAAETQHHLNQHNSPPQVQARKVEFSVLVFSTAIRLISGPARQHTKLIYIYIYIYICYGQRISMFLVSFRREKRKEWATK
jgi:hypothetical protein